MCPSWVVSTLRDLAPRDYMPETLERIHALNYRSGYSKILLGFQDENGRIKSSVLNLQLSVIFIFWENIFFLEVKRLKTAVLRFRPEATEHFQIAVTKLFIE